MTQLEFLQDQKARCLKWLAMPETELSGTLTHQKAADLLDQTEDELLDFVALQVTPTGMRPVLIEREAA